MQVVMLFALIGAVCMFIVTGGVISMSEEEPTSSGLGLGAAVGGGLGAAIAAVTGTEGVAGDGNIITHIGGPAEVPPTDFLSPLWGLMGYVTQEEEKFAEASMKVGFPTF